MIRIPFNKPFLAGNETQYITDAVNSGKISGNGIYTKKCHHFLEQRYGIKKALLTTSCTDALEMAAMLLNIQPNDEVIVPSFTFVSSALAFIRQGATIVFADSMKSHPNIDANKIEQHINERTKAIVVVHYGGVACDMNKIMTIAKKYNLFVVEDAAHAIEALYEEKHLGTIGHLAAFSFHETKNIISGEGGLLAINDDLFLQRAEILWEKGTNRAQFSRGEINKYGWVDIGSSFLPSEIISAFLFAQLENIDAIQQKRISLWNYYKEKLTPLACDFTFEMPDIPSFASNNAHVVYIVCNSLEERSELINEFKSNGVLAVFHYQSLHLSDFFLQKNDKKKLENCEKFSENLLRLPLFFELTFEEIDFICKIIADFYSNA